MDEDEDKRTGNGDAGPNNVKQSSLDFLDDKVANNISGELWQVDKKSVEVEIKTKLIDKHCRGVVHYIDRDEEKHHEDGYFSKGAVFEQI